MNRPQVAASLYGEISKGLPALQSLVVQAVRDSAYQKNFRRGAFSQTKVISLLKSKGCTGGPDKPSKGNDKIFSCPNVGKLSFRFHTTTGNQLRALTFEIIQQQLKSVGIELVPRFQTGGVMFGTTLPSRDWDLMLFAWVGSPASSITRRTSTAAVATRTTAPTATGHLRRCSNTVSTTLDAAERATLLNAAELKYMVKDIPSIPMFARPLYTINAAKVKGMAVNPTQEGSPWNISQWTTQ